MDACRVCAKKYYEDTAAMIVSIVSRAAFENEPLNLCRTELYGEFDDAIKTYKSTSQVEALRRLIERKVFASMRNVDALLSQGKSRRLSDGGFELEMRTIAGVNYSLTAWDDRRQTRRLQVSVPVALIGRHYVAALTLLPRLTKQQIASLRFRYTTDGWKSSAVARMRLRKDDEGRFVLSCDRIENLPPVGRLEGSFSFHGSAADMVRAEEITCIGYAFTVPDRQELMKLARGISD
jgi:hypothetical protein